MRHHIRSTHRQVFALACLLLGLIVLAVSPVIHAQQSNGAWSSPLLVSEDEGSNREPAIIADQTGVLHAFWMYQEEGYPLAINYARWDGEIWTQPVDVIVMPTIQGPSATVDQFGQLHLIWQGPGNTLFYSTANVDAATSALGWSSPIALAQSNLHAHLVADHQGILHLVYPGTGDTGVYYAVSTDGAATWNPPEPVARPVNARATTDFARISVTPSGDLHVVWTELQLPDGLPPLGIYYARSQDGGQTWSVPQSMDRSSSSMEANVVAVNEDEIYVAWNESGGITGRFLRWSEDGGNTWSDPVMIAPPETGGSSTNPPGLAVDSAGTVHVVVNTQPGGVAGTDATMYSYGTRDKWSALEDVSWRAREYNGLTNEASAIAVTTGNRISIVFVDRDGARLWHTWRTSSAPEAEATPFRSDQTRLSVAPSITQDASVSSPTPEVTVTSTPIQSTFNVSGWEDQQRAAMSQATVLIIAVLPTVLVVGGIALFTVTRRRTR